MTDELRRVPGPDVLDEDDRDLGLITDYLAGELDPRDVADVERRLESDAAFRERAAPIIAMFNLYQSDRVVVSDEEVQRSWDEFSRKAGFVRYRRARMRRAIWYTASVVVLALATYLLRGSIANAWWRTGFVALRDSGQVVRLADGTTLRIGAGGRVDVHQSFGHDTIRWVRVRDGQVRIVATSAVESNTTIATNGGALRVSGTTTRRRGPFAVYTRGGVVRSNGGEFALRVHGDTTVLSAGAEGAVLGSGGGAVYFASTFGGVEKLFAGERASVIRGRPVVKDIPHLPASVMPASSGASPVPAASAAPAAPPAGAMREHAVQPATSATQPRAPVSMPREPSASPATTPALPPAEPWVTQPGLTIAPGDPLPGSGPLLQLPRGVIARLAAGATLTVQHPDNVPMDMVFALEGSAILLVPRDTTSGSTLVTYVRTAAGWVAIAAPSAVRIIARGDTTVAEVLKFVGNIDRPGPFSGASLAFLYPLDLSRVPAEQALVVPGAAARVVRGAAPQPLPQR